MVACAWQPNDSASIQWDVAPGPGATDGEAVQPWPPPSEESNPTLSEETVAVAVIQAWEEDGPQWVAEALEEVLG